MLQKHTHQLQPFLIRVIHQAAICLTSAPVGFGIGGVGRQHTRKTLQMKKIRAT
jgi:hypothetical protein